MLRDMIGAHTVFHFPKEVMDTYKKDSVSASAEAVAEAWARNADDAPEDDELEAAQAALDVEAAGGCCA